MPLSWKIFAWTHKCHWHLARNSIARYASQHEGLCHFPTWPSFCKHHVKGHRSPPALEAPACTESLSPPGLDTSTGTWCIYWLFSTCSVAFLHLITIKTSSLSSYKDLLFQYQKLCYTEALISLLNIHVTYNQLQLQEGNWSALFDPPVQVSILPRKASAVHQQAKPPVLKDSHKAWMFFGFLHEHTCLSLSLFKKKKNQFYMCWTISHCSTGRF